MDLLDSLKKEKEAELKLLRYYSEIVGSAKTRKLICKKDKSKKRQFYFSRRGDRKQHYIGKKDYELIKTIIKEEMALLTVDVLEENIERINELMERFKHYDINTIINQLSRAYKEAIKEIGETDFAKPLPEPVEEIDSSIPSENPYNRKDLVFPLSNGIMVRSKSEAIIGEFLLAAGIPFRYEKALDLVCVYEDEAGFKQTSIERIFPDFTIFLPNGNIIIWEHEGRVDKMDYRKRNMRKMMLYFENGFYVPHNMIITMEGNGNAFDPDAALRIINGFLKPLFA
ncbi:MAG: hypothetical protein IIU36_06240 [Firmicutes bacterium]|nr:hypothetical protein [Bacillota bacterium]